MKKKIFCFPLVLLVLLLTGFVQAQGVSGPPTDAFFRKVLKASPNSYFYLTDENSGNYEEKIAGGEFITRQSFILFDPYAIGKARYAKVLPNEDMERYLPETIFLQGELSCNIHFNGGKLPFIGYVNGETAGYLTHPGYDLMDAQALKLFARPVLKSKGAKESYANALLGMFANLRMRPMDCNGEITLLKSKFAWSGKKLTASRRYTSECETGAQTGEWAPREFTLQINFEFEGEHLASITSILWP